MRQDELVGHVMARAGPAGYGVRPLSLLTGRMTSYLGLSESSLPVSGPPTAHTGVPVPRGQCGHWQE